MTPIGIFDWGSFPPSARVAVYVIAITLSLLTAVNFFTQVLYRILQRYGLCRPECSRIPCCFEFKCLGCLRFCLQRLNGLFESVPSTPSRHSQYESIDSSLSISLNSASLPSGRIKRPGPEMPYTIRPSELEEDLSDVYESPPPKNCVEIFLGLGKAYLFLLAQLAFVAFLVNFPRPCTENLCRDKLLAIMDEVDLLSGQLESIKLPTSASHIDSERYAHWLDTEDWCDALTTSYDTCYSMPSNESHCNIRVGSDLGCGCAGREIYPTFSGWLRRVPNMTDSRRCSIGRPKIANELLRPAFDSVANLGWLVRSMFIQWEDGLRLVYPLRRVSDEFVTGKNPFGGGAFGSQGEDLNCMAVNAFNITHPGSMLCVDDHYEDADVAVPFRSTVEMKNYAFYVLYDLRDGTNESRTAQLNAFSALMGGVLLPNDQYLGYSITSHSEGALWGVLQGGDLVTRNVVHWNRLDTPVGSGEFSLIDQIHSLFGWFRLDTLEYIDKPKRAYIMFLHGDDNGKGAKIDNFPALNETVEGHPIFWVMTEDFPQKDLACNYVNFSRGGVTDDGSGYDKGWCYVIRKNETIEDLTAVFRSRLEWMFQRSMNRERLMVFPHVDKVENRIVLTAATTMFVDDPTSPLSNLGKVNRSIVGVNIDWDQVREIYSYCNDMSVLYEIDHPPDTSGRDFVTILYVLLVINFVLWLIILTSGTLHCFRLHRFSCFVMTCESVKEQFIPFLVVVFGLFTIALLQGGVPYTLNVLECFAMFGIPLVLQVFIGLCGLKLKRLSRPKKKSDSVQLKGVSLHIDRIVFDDFIKGTFENISIKSGELTAVMGHSGAGKSTFFNILLAEYVPKSLTATLSFQDMQSTVDSLIPLGRFTGFVPQEEVLPERLTVFESLLFQLQQMYRRVGRDVVDEWIDELGLGGMLRHKYANQLSGGQKKRLSVLKELVCANPIILLDEPTSGLDSSSTRDLIVALRRLARSGLAIVVIIHQPSSEIIQLFDKLYLFLKNRETVRCCQVDVNKDLTADMIDQFLEVPDLHIVEKPVDVSESSAFEVIDDEEVGEDDESAPKALPAPTELRSYDTEDLQEIRSSKIMKRIDKIRQKQSNYWLVRLWNLVPRVALQNSRDFMGIVTDIVVIFACSLSLLLVFSPLHDFEGKSASEIDYCLQMSCGDLLREFDQCSDPTIVLGCAFPKKNPLFLQEFMMLTCLGLIALITALRVFGEEKKNMKREFRSGVSFVQFFFVKLLLHIPRMLLHVFFFVALVYSSTCLRAPFLLYFSICFMLYVWVSCQGIFCSLLFPGKEKAVESTLIGIIVVMSQLLFSGIITTRSQVGLGAKRSFLFNAINIGKYLSFTFYGNEILFSAELKQYSGMFPMSVKEVIDSYEYQNFLPWQLPVVLSQILVWVLAGLVVLFWLYSPEKTRFLQWLSQCLKPKKKRDGPVTMNLEQKRKQIRAGQSLWLEYREEEADQHRKTMQLKASFSPLDGSVEGVVVSSLDSYGSVGSSLHQRASMKDDEDAIVVLED